MRKLIIAGIFSLFGTVAAQADIVSNFNTDTQGWKVAGDVSAAARRQLRSGGSATGYVSSQTA